MKTITQRAAWLIERTTPEQTYLRALLIFAAQNPGFEWANYSTGNWKESRAAYLSDSRPVTAQMHKIRNLAWRFQNLTNEVLKDASDRALSGRLQFAENNKGVYVDYCTGQYFCTEFRLAALSVIEAGLRAVDLAFEAGKAVAA